jgi:hypothetical protein
MAALTLDCTLAQWQKVTGLTLSGELVDFEGSGSFVWATGLSPNGIGYCEGTYTSQGITRAAYDPSGVLQMSPAEALNPYPNILHPPTCLLLLFRPAGESTPTLTPQPLSVRPNESKRFFPSDYWQLAGTTGDVEVYAAVNTYVWEDNDGELELTFTLTEIGNDEEFVSVPGHQTQRDLDNAVRCARSGIWYPRNRALVDGTGLLVGEHFALDSGPKD